MRVGGPETQRKGFAVGGAEVVACASCQHCSRELSPSLTSLPHSKHRLSDLQQPLRNPALVVLRRIMRTSARRLLPFPLVLREVSRPTWPRHRASTHLDSLAAQGRMGARVAGQLAWEETLAQAGG